VEYLLTILSSGRTEYIERTLDAANEFLHPAPSALYVYDDGASTQVGPIGDYPFTYDGDPRRIGMCAAHAKCWQAAAASKYRWVFHLEDDYVLLRPVDLQRLAAVIDAERNLVQMALVRTPWGAEVEHGGYIAQTPGWYQRRESGEYCDNGGRDEVMHPVDYAEWIEQRRNWTCAPSLMRTDLARAFPWPAEPGCETTIGPQIIDALPDAQFGLWGWGEAWCAHIGVDRAEGSFGY
jgi:hypothetical protein